MMSRLGLLGVAMVGLGFAGCSWEKPSPGTASTQTTSAGTSPTQGETGTAETGPGTKTAETTAKAEEPKAEPQAKFDAGALLAKIDGALKKNDLENAVDALHETEKHADKLSEKETKQLEALRAGIDAKLAEQTVKRRGEQVAKAAQLVAGGKLEEATQAIDDVLKNFPTEAERTKVEKLRKEIEDHRRRQRELGIAMQLLGSDKPTDIRGARSRLTADPDVAIPLVEGAIHGKDTRLAANALEMLRSFNAPEKTLPILIGVLAKADREPLWAVATRELTKVATPGAGPQLLELAKKITEPRQRAAILTALAAVSDPPPETLTALLPGVFQDGPELPLVLQAVRHAATVNGQIDVVTLRGFPDVSPDLEQKLAELPARLDALAKVTPATETSQSALALGIMTRLLAPQPIAGIKVVRASAEAQDSSAKAALDGVFNSVDVKTMWRHPSDKPVTLVLDMGVEKTVAGIKIWNHNEASGRHRGWKDVDVFVSNTSNSLKPVAKGVVPMAPGLADPQDYGSVIAVPCVRGRFLRLEARTYWQPDGVAGVSEIQVLGY